MEMAQGLPTRIGDPESIHAQAILRGEPIHILNMKDTARYASGSVVRKRSVDKLGLRSALQVPLINNGRSIGLISMCRTEVRAYTPDEIELIRTFCAQAVIAIENAQQFRELETRLEREQATSEVLGAISQSREFDVPVFDVILRNAASLCQADAAALAMGREGDTHQRLVATLGVDPATQAVYDDGLVLMDPAVSLAACAIVSGDFVHVPDMAETEGYKKGVRSYTTVVDDTGIRTNLFVPMISATGAIGALILWRKEVRPYTPDEIALVQTFAAQAVIAIENARQFSTTQGALARQTATSDILQVISRSPGNLQPVFERIVTSATRLCAAKFCNLWRQDDGLLYHCAANGFEGRDLSDCFAQWPKPIPRTGITHAVFASGEVQHITDAQDDSYADHALAREIGFAHVVGLPIFVGGQVWGCISLGWPTGATPQQAHLDVLETFADQVSIAVENARLFQETQEALEHQTATSDVLEVISRSPDAVQPVLDSILEVVERICQNHGSYVALLNEETGFFVPRSVRHAAQEVEDVVLSEAFAPDTATNTGRVALTGQPSAHRCNDRQCHARRSRDVFGGRDGRLCRQTYPRRPTD